MSVFESFNVNHLRDVLVQLEEQASGFVLADLPVPPWLILDISWARHEIEVMGT